MESDRKSLFRLARRFGFWLPLCAALRDLRMRDAIVRAGLRIGLFARPVVLPYAEAGIDVDKPSDHALAEGILRSRRLQTT